MTDTIASQSEPAPSADKVYQQALQQTLLQAVSCHQAGQLAEAGLLYRAVLQGEPEHAQANHHLGMLMLELRQPAASLPHFEAALAAKPESERYWLSYIEALTWAGQTGRAREMLAFGREHGLEGDAVDALAQVLEVGGEAADAPGAGEFCGCHAVPPESPGRGQGGAAQI